MKVQICRDKNKLTRIGVSERGADRGPHAGSPRGVVDATRSYTQPGLIPSLPVRVLTLTPRLLVSILLALVVCPGNVTRGQRGGGKAEPLRIEFKRGSTSTTIGGTVRGSEEAEYVLSAKKGQRLTIKLTSVPVKSSVFQLLGEDNDTLGLEYDANFNYSGVLPKTGDYFISVRRPTEAKGTSRYKLIITVR